MGHGAQAGAIVELVDLIGVCRAVRNNAAKPHLVVLGFGLNRLNDAIHREDRIEIVGGHNQAIVGVLQRGGETTTHHIAEHIEDHHIGVFQQMVLLEQLHGLPGHVSAAARARRWAAALDALHPVEAGEDEILRPQLFAVEVHLLEDVDHRRHHLVGEGEGAVVLGVAADLKHPLAQLREGG